MNSTTTMPMQTRRSRPRKGLGPLHEPAAFVDGPNQYQYVGGDPVGAVDPEGRRTIVVYVNTDQAVTGKHPSTQPVTPRTDAGEAFLRGLVDAYTDYIKATRAYVAALSDDQFNDMKIAGLVTFGRATDRVRAAFKGNRQQFLAQLDREATSTVEVAGGPRATVGWLEVSLRRAQAALPREWDQAALIAHGDPKDPDGVVGVFDSPDGDLLSLADFRAKLVSKARPQDLVAACGVVPGNTAWVFSVVPPAQYHDHKQRMFAALKELRKPADPARLRLCGMDVPTLVLKVGYRPTTVEP